MNEKNAHIFLAGGGGAEDSRLLDEQFVKALDLAKPLVYIPNAMQSRPYQSCFEWFRSVVIPLGVTTIEMWNDLHPRYRATAIAGVYIGGGDAVKLLKELHESGFDDFLLEVVRGGIPLYGGSAGAIILGEDIRSAPEAKHLTPTEAVGLKIIERHSIVCHYRAEDEEATQTLAKTLRQHIIAIPERAGGYLAGTVLTNYGTASLTIFQEDRTIRINPHCSTELQVRLT